MIEQLASNSIDTFESAQDDVNVDQVLNFMSDKLTEIVDDDDDDALNVNVEESIHFEIQIDKEEDVSDDASDDDKENEQHIKNRESLGGRNDDINNEPQLYKKQSSLNPANLTPLYRPESPINRGSRHGTISILTDEMMLMDDLDIDDNINFIIGSGNRKLSELSASIQPGTETVL